MMYMIFMIYDKYMIIIYIYIYIYIYALATLGQVYGRKMSKNTKFSCFSSC